MTAVAARERSLREWISRALAANDVASVIETLARGDFQSKVVVEDIQTVVRLPGWTSAPFDELVSRQRSVRAEQSASDQDLAVRNADARATWWLAPGGRQWLLQTFAPSSLAAEQASFDFAFNEATKLHVQVWQGAPSMTESRLFQGALFADFGRRLIEAALKMIFDPTVRWEWEVHHRGQLAWFTNRGDARRLLASAERGASGDRQDELRATRACLARSPRTHVAVSAARLVAYDPSTNTHLGEVDGIVVSSDNVGDLKVALVEAKRQRTSARGAARKQQDKLLKALRIRTGIRREPNFDVQDGRLGYAVATLTAAAWAPRSTLP